MTNDPTEQCKDWKNSNGWDSTNPTSLVFVPAEELTIDSNNQEGNSERKEREARGGQRRRGLHHGNGSCEICNWQSMVGSKRADRQ